MLVLTGREARTLPPMVVRGLMWRAFVQRALPIIAAANAPLPDNATVQDKIDRADRILAVRELEATLFDG